MLCWKNRPIRELSERELRSALSESVTLILKDSDTDESHNVFLAFVAGTFVGLFAAGIGMSLTLLI